MTQLSLCWTTYPHFMTNFYHSGTLRYIYTYFINVFYPDPSALFGWEKDWLY